MNTTVDDDLSIGQSNPIPTIYRSRGLREVRTTLTGPNEYIYVDKETEIAKTYNNMHETPMGISCMILSSPGLNVALNSNNLGRSCFISNHRMENGLALYIVGAADNKPACYHCLVYPTLPTTLIQFLQNFSNWHVCHAVSQAEDHGLNEWEIINENFTMDCPMIKLIRLLNSFARSLRGSAFCLAIRIKNAIRESNSFIQLIDSEDLAFAIYAFLYHLNETLEENRVSSLIFVESLMDVIDSRYNISDKWTIVNLSGLVNLVGIPPFVSRL